MKFWLRWLAGSVGIFLALYLMDSVLHGRFKLEATWAAVVAAILLGFVNSFVRPLHRGRAKPQRAALAVLLTIVVNALILQIFVWVGADITTRGFVWVIFAAAFITLVSGLINWQVGFRQKEKPRPSIRDSGLRGKAATSGGANARRTGRG